MRKRSVYLAVATLLWLCSAGYAGEQPVAIFHAFDESFPAIEKYVCDIGGQGYSHLQIPPAQKSKPDPIWWARYQPLNYSVIEGRGSESQLKSLIKKAHGCNVKIIADVVFNHMTGDPGLGAATLTYPEFGPADFHPKWTGPGELCQRGINYSDGNRNTEIDCRLEGMPDLDQTKEHVQKVQTDHLAKLLALGIDGFRFDAAKHMTSQTMQNYINFINRANTATWNYLEVIEDGDTKGEDYNKVAAVTDFRLFDTIKNAFSYGGDLRSLRVPYGLDDSRSVIFGANHDTAPDVHGPGAVHAYNDRSDTYLATAYILARQGGTPLVLGKDNYDIAYIRAGVRFRSIMRSRAAERKDVTENVLDVVPKDRADRVLIMERGGEGFFVVNKGGDDFNVGDIDLTLTHLEGCYKEQRKRDGDFYVGIQREGAVKRVTSWGTKARRGMDVKARDALYFVRDPWEHCQ